MDVGPLLIRLSLQEWNLVWLRELVLLLAEGAHALLIERSPRVVVLSSLVQLGLEHL